MVKVSENVLMKGNGIRMVNEEKLRIMVNLARYEQEPLHTELKEAGYYRIDYIRSHLLVTLWSYSVAYVLVLFLIALYHFEYLLSKVRLPEIGSLAAGALAVYLILLPVSGDLLLVRLCLFYGNYLFGQIPSHSE